MQTLRLPGLSVFKVSQNGWYFISALLKAKDSEALGKEARALADPQLGNLWDRVSKWFL